MAMATTVLIVDDHPSFRDGARLLLESDGYEVVGEATDGASALSCTDELCPDVVLLDINLPDIDGFEVAGRLACSHCPPSVVLTSSRDASDYGALVERSDVRGFIPKPELSGRALAALVP